MKNFLVVAFMTILLAFFTWSLHVHSEAMSVNYGWNVFSIILKTLILLPIVMCGGLYLTIHNFKRIGSIGAWFIAYIMYACVVIAMVVGIALLMAFLGWGVVPIFFGFIWLALMVYAFALGFVRVAKLMGGVKT